MDVVIVGAGAAGVGAGLALQAAGVPFVIVEAADRVGGRAYTDKTSLHAPWDQGCHWFHCADVNPLVPWADRLGVDYEKRDRIDLSRDWVAGRWLDDDELARSGEKIDAAFAEVYAAAGRGEEGPMAGPLRRGGGAPIIPYVARLMASADPEEVSTIGYARYADTQVNLSVRSGLGDLVQRMAAGLPVRLSTPVSRVDQGARGVRVTTPAGVIEAKAAIVTASTNVLTSGAIVFGSEAARGMVELMQDVPCGAYEKIAVALRRLPMDMGDTQFLWVDPGTGARALNFQIAPTAAPVLIAHVGGTDAVTLAHEGREAMVALAVERLADAFGSGIRGEVAGAAVTGWQSSPWVRGAYSYTKPGLWQRRDAMISAETGDIHFAGEAFSPDWYATAHGAWQTGQDVAARVVARIAG